MDNFFFNQFSEMFTPESFAVWLGMAVCFIVDYFLVKRSSVPYLERSISVFPFPSNLNALEYEKVKKIPDFREIKGRSSEVFFIARSMSHYYWYPDLAFEKRENLLADGRLRFTPLKFLGYLLAFLFFFLIFKSDWADPFEKMAGSFLGVPTVFFLFVAVIFFNVAYGIKTALTLLKAEKLDIEKPEVISDKSLIDFREETLKLKKRLFWVFALYLPAAIPMFLLFGFFRLEDPWTTYLSFGYFLSFAGTMMVLSFKIHNIKCVKCGHYFFRKPMWHNMFSGKCLHCGLRLKDET